MFWVKVVNSIVIVVFVKMMWWGENRVCLNIFSVMIKIVIIIVFKNVMIIIILKDWIWINVILKMIKNIVFVLILKSFGDVIGFCVSVCINKFEIVRVVLVNNVMIVFDVCVLVIILCKLFLLLKLNNVCIIVFGDISVFLIIKFKIVIIVRYKLVIMIWYFGLSSIVKFFNYFDCFLIFNFLYKLLISFNDDLYLLVKF